jgi:hypothetical protein
MVGAAVIVVLFAVWVGKSAWSRPNAGARLAALLGLIIGCWFIFAAGSPSGAGTIALDAAKGVMELAAGLGSFLKMLLVPDTCLNRVPRAANAAHSTARKYSNVPFRAPSPTTGSTLC